MHTALSDYHGPANSLMHFQPANSLKSRTFLGLLVAQFLAAFNDQAIHASAMFFAIHRKTLSQADAISLMPILFYAPWAIFCTLAGYMADRYSKRQALVFWKVAEVGIALVALIGFYLGSVHGSRLGPWMVLSTVFLMGMHSAFFVPAKYGAMPEILQPHLLSRGNGLLESLSFLAVILGTVSGGVLSSAAFFKGMEWAIGIVLLSLALVGAGASFLIEKMPAANPTRPFPSNLFKPLFVNLKTMLASRQLALAVLAIAFFTFVVAFMRGTMYMHGETRNPRWNELHTSIVVGVVALGIGLGSPLAGFFSGGKVELGLVPLGSVGMIVSLAIISVALNSQAWLIGCLVAIGFFTGFYIVPMYTLLQHRAPKASKGDLLASSNFINVVGAIAASVLFKVLVLLASLSGITHTVQPVEVARGTLFNLDLEEGHLSKIQVTRKDKPLFDVDRSASIELEREGSLLEEVDDGEGSEVVVGRYELTREGHKVVYYKVQPADVAFAPVADNEPLTRYLFLAAGILTLLCVIALRRLLPDFFLRSVIWIRGLGRYRLHVTGTQNLPSEGSGVLITNCARFDEILLVLAATDRYARFFLWRGDQPTMKPWVIWRMARNSGLVVVEKAENGSNLLDVGNRASKSLDRGDLVALPAVPGSASWADAEKILAQIEKGGPTTFVPVLCKVDEAPVPKAGMHMARLVHVVIGKPLSGPKRLVDLNRSVQALAEGIHETEATHYH